MFQINPLSYTPEYLIGNQTPLAPLDPNACPHFSLHMAFSSQTTSNTSKYSHKGATENPLLQRNAREEQNRRRKVFLEKVRQVSDDKNWESRSEQVRSDQV